MAAERFTPGSLDSKLRDLNSTMQSIQGVSQWLITHKKYAKTIVGVWFREMQKGWLKHGDRLSYSVVDILFVELI